MNLDVVHGIFRRHRSWKSQGLRIDLERASRRIVSLPIFDIRRSEKAVQRQNVCG